MTFLEGLCMKLSPYSVLLSFYSVYHKGAKLVLWLYFFVHKNKANCKTMSVFVLKVLTMKNEFYIVLS